MNREHITLAKQISEKAEENLSDASEFETLDIGIACTRTGYVAGALYLEALQARRRAARKGHVAKLIQFSRVVAETRKLVLADASVDYSGDDEATLRLNITQLRDHRHAQAHA